MNGRERAPHLVLARVPRLGPLLLEGDVKRLVGRTVVQHPHRGLFAHPLLIPARFPNIIRSFLRTPLGLRFQQDGPRSAGDLG
eukprot:8228978-Pyramimonas_sp.AAC.2